MLVDALMAEEQCDLNLSVWLEPTTTNRYFSACDKALVYDLNIGKS